MAKRNDDPNAGFWEWAYKNDPKVKKDIEASMFNSIDNGFFDKGAYEWMYKINPKMKDRVEEYIAKKKAKDKNFRADENLHGEWKLD